MSDLFIAQFAKPAHFGPINLRALTPFQRALLSTDGTVTQYIEAYTMEPVKVVRLRQEMKPLSDYHVWLEAPKGTQAIFRQVLIQSAGLKSASVLYAYATSVIVISRLPEMVREGLDSEAGGLGMLLLHSQLETRRDLLWYGMERVSDLPSQIAHLSGQLFISRTYRIVSGGKPMMLINERFPLGIEN